MRVLTIVHQRDAGPGVFAEAASAAGHELFEWMPPEAPPPADLGAFDAALVLGGAMNVDDEAKYAWLAPEKAILRELLRLETPALGVCLGSQLLAEAAGGGARRADRPEIGWFDVEVAAAGADDPLLGPLAPRFEAFEWHSYTFFAPAGASILASSEVGAQAARFGPATWAIQFHAEVSRAIVGHWIDDYRSDADAVRIGLDPEALRAESEQKLAGWNELGRGLFGRWLDATRA